MLITKDYFEEIGGFDPALSSGEDYEFCQRAKKMGFSVELEPSLQVIHNDFPTTLKQFFRREIWHGIGDFKSLSSFLSSRVALLSTAYTTLAALAITSLLFNYKIAPIFILAALSIPTACSIKKFPALQPDIRIGNLAIWNIYLFARFLSFFFKAKKKRPYETK